MNYGKIVARECTLFMKNWCPLHISAPLYLVSSRSERNGTWPVNVMQWQFPKVYSWWTGLTWSNSRQVSRIIRIITIGAEPNVRPPSAVSPTREIRNVERIIELVMIRDNMLQLSSNVFSLQDVISFLCTDWLHICMFLGSFYFSLLFMCTLCTISY